MARATITNRCTKCSKTWNSYKNFFSSKDARSYEKYWADGKESVCQECSYTVYKANEFTKALENGCTVVVLKYFVFKNEYANLKTVANSYDKSAKTIKVLADVETVADMQKKGYVAAPVKKSYDRKKIMKRAWEVYRENEKMTFAEALKLAWAEAKAN